VHWLSWSDQAFEQARRDNRPVVIDIGASWSHDSLQMEVATYQNKQVADALNSGFTTVKVDADLRPDIWARYQVAYELINKKRAELPLTVFALPDGRPFDCMSYVGPESKDKEAGMVELLGQVSKLMSDRRKEAESQADQVEAAVKKVLAGPAETNSSLDKKALETFKDFLTRRTDTESATDLIKAGRCALYLLHYYSDSGDKSVLKSASDLLLERFKSGQRDNVMGGYFSRLWPDGSVSFGKTLPVQAEFISANALAYAADKKSLHKEAVGEVLRFCRDTLEATDGGFYSSQAPDVGPDDDGSYFTWTPEEIRAIAGETPQTKVFEKYLNADSANGGRAILHVTSILQDAADAAGLDYNTALKALDEVRVKLHDARMAQQKFPYVNKAIMAGWNGDLICAYLDAFQYTGNTSARDFALKSADRIISSMVDGQKGVGHVLYKKQVSGYGFLDDNVKMAAALIRCFEVSGQHEYLDSARSLMDFVESRFLDNTTGLYRDTMSSDKSGLMKLVRCPIEDDMTPSPNAVAAQVWYHFYQATSDDACRKISERLTGAAMARRGLSSGAMATWGEAASMLVNGSPKALIIGNPDDTQTSALHAAALPVFRMGKFVEVLSPEAAKKTDYPPASDGKPIAYVCTQQNCAPPVKTESKVVDLLKDFGRVSSADPAGSTSN
jgi:uncharacterized protein YyaL (SSP411 family)